LKLELGELKKLEKTSSKIILVGTKGSGGREVITRSVYQVRRKVLKRISIGEDQEVRGFSECSGVTKEKGNPRMKRKRIEAMAHRREKSWKKKGGRGGGKTLKDLRAHRV